MAAPRNRTNAAPASNIAPLIAGLAPVAAIAATAFRLPGALVALIVLVAAAWMSTPPELTGQKDRRGTASLDEADRQQVSKMLTHRVFDGLRWRLIFPSADWLLNDPAELRQLERKAGAAKVLGYLSWLLLPGAFTTYLAIGAAAVAWTLPVDQLSIWLPQYLPGSSGWLAVANAAAAYVTVKQLAAQRRRNASLHDPRPAVGVTELAATIRTKGGSPTAVVVMLALASSVLGAIAAAVIFSTGYAWLISPAVVTGAGVAAAAFGLAGRAMALPSALEQWSATVQARAEWSARWPQLKLEPAPTLISHRAVAIGDDMPPASVDEFDVSPGIGGADAIIRLRDKIAPLLNTADGIVKVSCLPSPATGAQGEPIPGTAHATRMRIVSWPAESRVDISDPEADEAAVRLKIETGIADAGASLGLQVIHVETRAVFEGEGTAAWASSWVGLPPLSDGLIAISGAAASALGAEVMIDGDTVYAGALGDTTQFTDPGLPDRFEQLDREQRWLVRWRDVLKMGANRPWIQHAVYRQLTLPSGQTIEVQPFMPSQGIETTEYVNAARERQLASTLDNAPWVAVLGWEGSGDRPGERHPGAFRVAWSRQPIPSNPARIEPGTASGRGSDAATIALAAAVNQAFDTAKLPRPEVVRAIPLTSRQSEEHIWDITLRLYGGATLAAVKASIEKLRQGLGGCEWLRVTLDPSNPDWCRIVAGARPSSDRVAFARPRNFEITVALDWEQAFADAKLIGGNGQVPTLVSSSKLATNEKVQAHIFDLPAGMTLAQLREAIPKLRSATGMAWIDVREGDSASRALVRACEVDPMPFPALMDWNAMRDDAAIPFATAVDGSTIHYDWRDNPHLLVVGVTGGGKSVTLQALVNGAILRGCDVYVIDPVKGAADFQFAKPWLKALVGADDYVGAGVLAGHIYDEITRRKRINAAHGVSSYSDLPDDVRYPHAFVFIDEFQSLITMDRVPREPASPAPADVEAWEAQKLAAEGKYRVAQVVGQAAREARSAGVTLILAGQQLKADDLNKVGAGGLKVNLARMAVGKMSWGELASAFRDPSGIPPYGDAVPKGRGVFEPLSAPAFSAQMWFEPGGTAEMERQLRDSRPPLDDAERFDLDVARDAKLAAQDSAVVFGRRIEADAPTADTDEEVFDEGVVDLGIDFDEPDESVSDEPWDLELEPIELPPADFELAELEPLPLLADEGDEELVFVGPGIPAYGPEIAVSALPEADMLTGVAVLDAIATAAREHGATRIVWRTRDADRRHPSGLNYRELLRTALDGVEVRVEIVADVEPVTPATAHEVEEAPADDGLFETRRASDPDDRLFG